MPVEISDQLRDAILELPKKEKDKLLIRLLRKDKKTVSKLQFDLLEGTPDDVERRQQVIRDSMLRRLPTDAKYLSPGIILMDLRSLSGDITEHTRVTKDKTGEIELSLLILNHVFTAYRDLLNSKQRQCDTLAPYVVKKLDTLIKKADKLDEDYQWEFREGFNAALEFVHEFPPTKMYLRDIPLPRKWGDW